MADQVIRVAIIEDQGLIRSALVNLVADMEDIEVVLEAADGQAALQSLTVQDVDVIVADVRMPRMDGIELTRHLRQLGDPTPVLLLTTFEDDRLMLAGVAAGAQGFALKDISPEDLHKAIVGLARGEHMLQPVSPTDLVLEADDDAPRLRIDRKDFSERELQILKLLMCGYTNKEIAAAVHLAVGTVRNRVSIILEKLAARDRTQAVVNAIRAGIFSGELRKR
jgi:DNA-binding NarL/FixJ family response regulator